MDNNEPYSTRLGGEGRGGRKAIHSMICMKKVSLVFNSDVPPAPRAPRKEKKGTKRTGEFLQDIYLHTKGHNSYLQKSNRVLKIPIELKFLSGRRHLRNLNIKD